MKRRIMDIVLTVLIVLMLGGLLFSQEANSNTNVIISNQISDFEQQISNSEVIVDGTISSDIMIDYSGNKISQINAKVSYKIRSITQALIHFIQKVLKKLIS